MTNEYDVIVCGGGKPVFVEKVIFKHTLLKKKKDRLS